MPAKRARSPNEEDACLAAFYAARLEEQERSNPGYAAAWASFAKKVLAHGGRHVVPPMSPDPMVGLLARAGRVLSGPVTLELGKISDCHRNAVKLWRSGKGSIATGYALSADELWREHSWCVSPSGAIVETTEPRTAYFGLVLEGKLAEKFAKMVGG